MPTTAILEINNLCCVRNGRVLFADLNRNLNDGQMLWVEGPNGSGKSSLLRILTGLKSADSGDILWQGQSITRLGSDYSAHISYVGHQNGIKAELSCLENLRLIQALGCSKRVDVEVVLDQIKLSSDGNSPAGRLSAGQKRRLALARLLILESKLWVLDEPFSALDKSSKAYFHRLCEQHLEQQGLLVMTAHDEMPLFGSAPQRLYLPA